MGRILLIIRLARRDLRRRRAEAVLMLATITAATAALALGLALNGVTRHPYQQTRAATAGPDVIATASASAGRPPASMLALEHARGVTGSSGPYPVAFPTLRANGHVVTTADGGFGAEGRDEAPASVDQPKVIQGTWVRPGGVVIEPTYAAELGVRTGDRITLDGRPFRVSGLAVTAAWPSVNAPGQMWLTVADARSLSSAADPLAYTLNLKLAAPASAAAWAGTQATSQLSMTTWQEISSHDARGIQIEQVALSVGSSLLALLAIASVAVLVGGRIADQVRRLGLLKAVGGTPRLVAAVVLAEHLVVALAAGAAGLAAGWLAAPLLSSPADGLIGSAGPPSLTAGTIGAVVALALGVALLATLVPAIRAARVSTVAALADAARTPRRGAWLIRASRRLPVPLLVGLRLTARRPRRLALSAASIAVTVAMVIGVLNTWHRRQVSKVPGGLINPVHAGVNRVLLVVAAVLVILAAINVIFVAQATVLDSRRPLAVTRSLGATQEQVSAGVAAAQLVSALLGALIGVPAGLGLVVALSHSVVALPPAWELLCVVPGTLVGVAGLAAVPARLGGRRPLAEVLQSETA